MPGYIIHLTEAEMILSLLGKVGFSYASEEEEAFLLGALLPDTKIKREKVTSHFWQEERLTDLAIPPQLSAFEKKYDKQLQGALMMGYWAHLHLDELFVEEFWPATMTFYGEDGLEKIKRDEITRVYLKEYEKEIPLDLFFTSEYYYGDYNRTNHVFFDRFRLRIPRFQEGLVCPVTEVEVGDLKRLLGELQEMLKREPVGDQTLRVFDEEKLVSFLKKTAWAAAEQILRMETEKDG